MAVVPVISSAGQSNDAGMANGLWLKYYHPTLADQSALQIWNGQSRAIEDYDATANANTTALGGLVNPAVFGLEAKLGSLLAADLEQTVYVFKHAVVGSLGPRVHGLPIWNKAAGEAYSAMLTEKAAFEAALAVLGHTPNYLGFWWVQGESDVLNGAVYGSYLETLVSDIRSDFGDSLPFFVARLHSSFSATQQVGANVVRSEQFRIVSEAADPNLGLIDTDALSVANDEVHFDEQGILDLGQLAYDISLLDDPGTGAAEDGTTTTVTYDTQSEDAAQAQADAFGEDLVYTPYGGSDVAIKAVVDRDGMETLEDESRTEVFRLGISASGPTGLAEITSGKDKVSLPPRIGEPAVTMLVEDVESYDGYWWQVRCLR